jgi:hypothetical protein
MAQFEVTLTASIDAANEAEAEKKKGEVQKLLDMPMVKTMLLTKGVKLTGVGKVKAK